MALHATTTHFADRAYMAIGRAADAHATGTTVRARSIYGRQHSALRRCFEAHAVGAVAAIAASGRTLAVRSERLARGR